MSWLMRSRIKSYRFDVSRLTPPTETGSAVTPSAPAPLIRSTSASGKVRSIPKSTPIRFMRAGDYTVATRWRRICAFVAPARGSPGCGLNRAPDPAPALRSRGARLLPHFARETPRAAKGTSSLCFPPRGLLPHDLEGLAASRSESEDGEVLVESGHSPQPQTEHHGKARPVHN